MTPHWQKLVAREWLILLTSLLIGLLLPLFLALVMSMFVTLNGSILGLYLEALAILLGIQETGSSDRGPLVVIVLAPYTICQFIRSIIWSVKALRSR